MTLPLAPPNTDPSAAANAGIHPPTHPPSHRESRLDTALRHLLANHRVAALGTQDDAGLPSVSMVPFAIEPLYAVLVLHVSGLAAHTGHLQRQPLASLLVMQPEDPNAPVHALPRATLVVRAHSPLAGTPLHAACRTAYLARFPEAAPMTDLPDFRFVALQPLGARQVAGFGAARSVDPSTLQALLGAAPTAPPPLPTAPTATQATRPDAPHA